MRKIIIAGFLIFFSHGSFSQIKHLPANNDRAGYFTAIEKYQLEQLDSLYLAETGYEREFINGRDYVKYYYRSEHQPVLYPDRERTASIIYKGRAYKNLVLQYDTYLDQVIFGDNRVVYNNLVRQVALNRDNISRFVLYFDHDTLTFINISEEPARTAYPDPGFYELVYDGKCKYMIKHKSTLFKLHGADDYLYKPSGFIMVGTRVSKITSRKQFISLFGNVSGEISRFIRAEGINIRKAEKRRITDILRFYERISSGSR